MIADKIKKLRCEKGLSQEELANRLGVVRQTVSKWEKGLSVPDSDMLVSIAAELKTTVSAILDEEVVTEDSTTETKEEATSPVDKEVVENKSLNWMLLIIIILGSPVWASLLIAAAAVVISLFVSLWAMVVSLWSAVITLVACGVGGVAACIICAITGRALEGVMIMAMGLVSSGLSIFAFYGCKWVTCNAYKLTKKGMALIANCIKRRKK